MSVKRISDDGHKSASATMRDVAALAGVSQATVSYVLNAKPGARISSPTRERVIDAAERLRYQPNAIARAMVSGRSNAVGVYQPHAGETPLSGIWPMQVIQGIGEALHARELHLLLYGYREADEPAANVFLDGRVDGLVILAPHEGDTLPSQLSRTGLPVAIVGGRAVSGPCVVSADADNCLGGQLAVEHLLSLGHRRIAHLAGPEGVPNAVDRLRGYREALSAAGPRADPEIVVPSGFDERSGYTAGLAALVVRPRPTALFVANDIAALGVLRACQELGLRVPDDVSIVGYDDAPVCVLVRPRLTTVRQPTAAMGRSAAQMLIALVDGEPIREPSVVFPPRLEVRESTARPP